MKQVLLFISILIMLCSCQKPVHIGAKNFSEQLLIAEMMAQLIENKNIPVKRIFPYGSTLECFEAVKNNDIDLYAEYTGTAAMLVGKPTTNDANKALENVKKFFADNQSTKNLTWNKPFGFNNSYVVLMKRDKARRLKIKTISDLEKLSSGIRFSCDNDYLKRPVDGFSRLLMRYGLKKSGEVLAIDDKNIMYKSLASNKVDVAIGYSTDGQIDVFDFVILKDDLRFFPIYEPVPLIHKNILKQYPALQKELEKLSGVLTTSKMRELNRKVELSGEHYKSVATRFLQEMKLLPRKKVSKSKNEMVITVQYIDDLIKGETAKAQLAIRKTFAGREITIKRTGMPSEFVEKKKARIAQVSAESLYQNKNLEAFAVVGYRMAHLLSNSHGKYKSISEMKKIGVGFENGVSHRSAQILLKALKLEKTIKLVPIKMDKIKEYDNTIIQSLLIKQATKVKENQLDALFLMVPIKHSTINYLLKNFNMKLLPIKEWQQKNYRFLFPFFRLSRIPINSYEKQNYRVETMSTQIVLVQPSLRENLLGGGGPGSAIYSQAQPLSSHHIRKINMYLEVKEQIDPILNVSKVLAPKRTRGRDISINPSYESSILNVFVIIGVIYLFVLFFREKKE